MDPTGSVSPRTVDEHDARRCVRVTHFSFSLPIDRVGNVAVAPQVVLRMVTKFFDHCAHRATPSEGFTISTKCRASLGARQEIADCRSDLVTVRLESEVAGVEEAHLSVWNV